MHRWKLINKVFGTTEDMVSWLPYRPSCSYYIPIKCGATLLCRYLHVPCQKTQVFIWKSFHSPKSDLLRRSPSPGTSDPEPVFRGELPRVSAGPWPAPGESEGTFRLSALRSCSRGSTKPSTPLCCKFERLRSELGFNKKKKHRKKDHLCDYREVREL